MQGHMPNITRLDCYSYIEAFSVSCISDIVDYHAEWITAVVARLPDLALITLRCYLIDYINLEDIDEGYNH